MDEVLVLSNEEKEWLNICILSDLIIRKIQRLQSLILREAFDDFNHAVVV